MTTQEVTADSFTARKETWHFKLELKDEYKSLRPRNMGEALHTGKELCETTRVMKGHNRWYIKSGRCVILMGEVIVKDGEGWKN
jgi:hypothetical protein